MKTLLVLLILWPGLALAQIAPPLLPYLGATSFTQNHNPLGIPNGYPYFGSASGWSGSHGLNGGFTNSGLAMGGNFGFNAPPGWASPYSGFNPYPSVNPFVGYNPQAGFSQYGGYNGGAFANLFNMLPGLFAGFNTNIGGMNLSLGINTGGCIGCTSGSMYRGGPSPINYRPQPVLAMGGTNTEAGVTHRPAMMPMAATDTGDRIASTAPEVLPMERTTREGVGPRAPAILPATSNEQELEARNSAIWDPFITALKACAADCQPAQYHAFGERANASCHTSSEALDVGAFICADGTHQAINKGRFETIVSCMRGHMEKVLYFDGSDPTLGHKNHAHFSNGCIRNGRKMW